MSNSDNGVIKSYVWHGAQCFFVSTIERDSSAAAAPSRYNETLVWFYDWYKRMRADSFCYHGCASSGCIVEHLDVCRRINDTGNPNKPEEE
jgi:hypothetical protein